MKVKNFTFKLQIIANCLLLPLVSLAGDSLGGNLNGTEKPDHVVLTWTESPETSQTISWRSAAAITNASVSFREASDKNSPFEVRQAAERNFTSGTGDSLCSMSLFSVTLNNLKPGTAYIYKISNTLAATSEYSFTTAAKDTKSFSFLVFGDSQSGDARNPNYAPWHTTLQNAFNANKDAKFIINMGDLVEVGQDYRHWNNWFNADEGILERIPEMPVQGNHETYSPPPQGGAGKPVNFRGLFDLPQNGPDNLKGQVYSYDYGNVHFTVLDSQEAEEAPVSGDILKAQAEWLDKDLAASQKPWKLVFFHKTPFYNKAFRANEMVKAAFCPILEKNHANIVFNGHDHGVSRTYPIKNDRLYSKPSQGTVYYVTGRSGAKYYNDLTPKIWDAFFYDPQDEPCYEVVTVNGNQLTVTARKQDGSLIDIYAINRDSDKDGTPTCAPERHNLTRVAAYGSLLGGSAVNRPSAARGKDGVWHVDARAFMAYLGGSIACSEGQLSLILGKNTYEIPAENWEMHYKEVPFLSADELKSLLGYSYRYDDSLNVLFFVK